MAKPTFDIAEELDLLEWDFTPQGQPRKSGAHGIVPEPSSGQLQTFTSTLRKIMAPLAAKAGTDPANLSAEQVAQALGEADESEAAALEMVGQLIAAVAAVCSDSPNAQQIADLPYRAQQRFFGWIVGTFMDPKQQGLATS